MLCLSAAGCQKKASAPAAAAGMQALPVQTYAVALQPVPDSSEYVATIKSRRSATIMPQVSGVLTAIEVASGQQVEAGQVMMTIDPRQQQAMVDSQRATEQQKKAVYDYNVTELERQKKLFEAGVTSRDVYDQEQQAFQNSKADFASAVESRKAQEQMLDYYTIRAPFAGIVGDIPVHVGDYVTTGGSSTMLTTVDEGKNLEAYVYIPTERANQIRNGLEVDVEDTNGKLLAEIAYRFHLAAGGLNPSEHPGQSVREPLCRYSAQHANGQGQGHLEDLADGGRTRARRHPPGRAEFCLRGKTE